MRRWTVPSMTTSIVEDISRYPLVIDKIVEHKGGVVPDFKMQHAGCSKRKRKATEPSRSYVMSPEVKGVSGERCKELRAVAARMCGR